MFEIGGEEMILCPYNRFHMVKKLRIQKHILKCKKNYPEINLATCIYNYTHRLKPEDMLRHYEICCHKSRLDGARYYDRDDFDRVTTMRSDRQSILFPDINVKACVSSEPKEPLQMEDPVCQQLDTENSDTEMPKLINGFRGHSSDDAQDSDADSDANSDLEPLPLPKTVSKAFVCVKKEQQKLEPAETSKQKGFGRGRSFLLHSSPKLAQRRNHLADLSDLKAGRGERIRSPWFYSKNDHFSGQSIRSSMLDDATTLKSVDISVDEDVIEDVLLKDLDKYVKI